MKNLVFFQKAQTHFKLQNHFLKYADNPSMFIAKRNQFLLLFLTIVFEFIVHGGHLSPQAETPCPEVVYFYLFAHLLFMLGEVYLPYKQGSVDPRYTYPPVIDADPTFLFTVEWL